MAEEREYYDEERDVQEGPEYIRFMPRLMASVLDNLLSLLLIAPVLRVVAGWFGLGSSSALLQAQIAQEPNVWKVISANPDLVARALADSFTEYVIFFIMLGVAVVLFWQYKSATPGKMLMRMKIVDATTFEKPSNGRLILRYAAYLVSTLPFLLGFFWIAIDKRRQGWHDKIANTVVISARTPEAEIS